jgi:hypothetical protein
MGSAWKFLAASISERSEKALRLDAITSEYVTRRDGGVSLDTHLTPKTTSLSPTVLQGAAASALPYLDVTHQHSLTTACFRRARSKGAAALSAIRNAAHPSHADR